MISMILFLLSCTDIAEFKSNGSSGKITCYSGGQVILEATSIGAIQTESGSDGWKFMDASTNRLVRVSGDCVIKN